MSADQLVLALPCEDVDSLADLADQEHVERLLAAEFAAELPPIPLRPRPCRCDRPLRLGEGENCTYCGRALR